ncbi:MAG: SRPBCC family protein [Actinomycetota bacterium]
MRVEREIVLPSSPVAAWEVLVDWERQADWMADADRVQVVSAAREGVGTTVDVRTRVLNIPSFTERLEVTGWDPPRELRMAHRSFIRGVGTWTLTPSPAGCRFRWVEDLALPVPLLGEAALLIYRPFMRHLMGRAMRDLQTYVGSLP